MSAQRTANSPKGFQGALSDHWLIIQWAPSRVRASASENADRCYSSARRKAGMQADHEMSTQQAGVVLTHFGGSATLRGQAVDCSGASLKLGGDFRAAHGSRRQRADRCAARPP